MILFEKYQAMTNWYVLMAIFFPLYAAMLWLQLERFALGCR